MWNEQNEMEGAKESKIKNLTEPLAEQKNIKKFRKQLKPSLFIL